MNKFKLEHRDHNTALPDSIIGRKFGKWIVLSFANKRKNETMVQVRCECGFEGIIEQKSVLKGKSKGCKNCAYKKRRGNVDIGSEFGDWIIISDEGYITAGHNKPKKHKIWMCRCKCGNEVLVRQYNLKNLKSLKCIKCANEARAKERNRLRQNFKIVEVEKNSQDPLIGKKIGKRLILGEGEPSKKGIKQYRCLCECGLISLVRKSRVQNGEGSACRSCFKSTVITIGTIFGKRTVLEFAGLKEKAKAYKVQCECGRLDIIRASALLKNRGNSCNSCASRKHGPPRMPVSNHPLQSTWNKIFERCYNPDHTAYHLYGDRGIKVHPRWHNMQNFVDDLGPRPSITHQVDRIDPDGDYSPDNCRWVTPAENAANRRRSKSNRDKYIVVRKDLLCASCCNRILNIKEESLK